MFVNTEMISLTLSTSYALINAMKQQDYISVIEETDVHNTIKVIHQFIDDILEHQYYRKNKALMLCITSIEDIIKEINNIMDRINTNLINYRNSWSKYIFSFNCSKEIKLLKNKILVLNNRNDLLIKIKSAF